MSASILTNGYDARNLIRGTLTSPHDAIDCVQRRGLLQDKPLLDIGVRTCALNANVNRQRLLAIEHRAEIKPTVARFAFPKTLVLVHDQDSIKPKSLSENIKRDYRVFAA